MYVPYEARVVQDGWVKKKKQKNDEEEDVNSDDEDMQYCLRN